MRLTAVVSIPLLITASSTTEDGSASRVLDSSAVSRIVSSRLTVQIPQSLFREGGYDHRKALFGIPPNGGSLAQNVYYADQDMCNVIVDTTKGFPMRPHNEPWRSPYILMVDRGSCTFVQKVRNAQRSGAAGVVIADNVCLCGDKECDTGPDGPCESLEPIVADDGSGADISIPSFLMFKKDADKVKDELKRNRPVRIEMDWGIPNPYNYVEYDLWTTPGDKIGNDFFSDFGPVAAALGKRAHFTPHMYIYDGVRSHCRENEKNFCSGLCTNEGRYCGTPPGSDFGKNVTGADVVRESLRRLCIWSLYGSRNGIGTAWWEYVNLGTAWWEYVNQFNEQCEDTGLFQDTACIKNAMFKAKVDWGKVEQCMMESGGTEGDYVNNKFEMQLSSQAEQGVVVIPTASVNSVTMRGALTVNNVFQAICSGFRSGTEPDICYACSGCRDTATCVKNNGRCATDQCTSGGGGRASFMWFPMIAILGGFVVGGFAVASALWHCKRTLQMNHNRREPTDGYMALEDQQDVDK